MKRIKSVIIFTLILMLLLSPILYADTPARKLGRGFCNVITSPLEIFKGVQDVNRENGFAAAFTWGLLQGMFKTGLRAVVGVYEIVTFSIPLPKDYEPILTDPEFFGEETVF